MARAREKEAVDASAKIPHRSSVPRLIRLLVDLDKNLRDDGNIGEAGRFVDVPGVTGGNNGPGRNLPGAEAIPVW